MNFILLYIQRDLINIRVCYACVQSTRLEFYSRHSRLQHRNDEFFYNYLPVMGVSKYIINLFSSLRHFILIYTPRYQERQAVKSRLRVTPQIFIPLGVILPLGVCTQIELRMLDWILIAN